MNDSFAKVTYLMLFGLMAISIVAAQTVTSNLQDALEDFCRGIRDLIPIVSFLMIAAGAVIYAVGQLMGAETRARASVWATAMFVGAIIGILIVALVPPLLSTIYGNTVAATVCGSAPPPPPA